MFRPDELDQYFYNMRKRRQREQEQNERRHPNDPNKL